jgi:hypothetical protein
MTRVEVAVAVLVSAFLLSLLPPVLRHAKSDAARDTCRANLAMIGKAMLVYANDYQDALPHAGGRYSVWGDIADWKAQNRTQAFGLDAQGANGAASISSCFYLLVKYAEVMPKCFVCPGDTGTTEFRLSDNTRLPQGFELIDAWDFGPEAYKHCSYAYHMPFGMYALTIACNPGLAVAADRNPFLASPAAAARDLTTFVPDLPAAGYSGTSETARQGNCNAHQLDGQNVLFLDTHVSFEKRSFCALEDDNIYTVAPTALRGDAKGMIPVPPIVNILSRGDSVLVHDPVREVRPPQEAPNVDSKNLRQTAVVATLDCPLPEHRNAIWCSTFQIAWDKFRQDAIGEPIRVVGAEELASRLNRAPFPTADIEDKSYYAAAGLVGNGIIEQIQSQMKKRFPAEPVPTFESGGPDEILAYAYLNVDVGFEYPYFTSSSACDFQDSTGAHTGVTAFGAQSSAATQERVRQQVHILYYEDGGSPEAVEFAVDLSRQTQPYQVVLACLPRGATFREAARTLQEKSAKFLKNPDYDSLCKLRPLDTLIVPDVAYKLTHSFRELLGKRFANPKWDDCWFFEAMQKIDFSLTRTGVVLKSEARLRATRGASADVEKPRHLHFDRPFLICVKKREPNATPFFLMWVDNAELMQPYDKSPRP